MQLDRCRGNADASCLRDLHADKLHEAILANLKKLSFATMGSGQIHDDHPNHHFFTPEGHLVSTKRLVYIVDQEDGLQRVRYYTVVKLVKEHQDRLDFNAFFRSEFFDSFDCHLFLLIMIFVDVLDFMISFYNSCWKKQLVAECFNYENQIGLPNVVFARLNSKHVFILVVQRVT